jgi:DNA invertase Pin-like site-specific DNA recombinase
LAVIYGYARVSDPAQDLAAQAAELQAAGCEKVFIEKASAKGGSARPVLARLMAALGPGDCLMVTRLNRVARSARDALNLLHAASARGAAFRSLRETWADTTTPAGRMVVTIHAAWAEYDREMILERTGEGRQRAKARGVRMGRAPLLSPRQAAYVRQEIAAGRRTRGELAAFLKVSRSTVSRAAREPSPKA